MDAMKGVYLRCSSHFPSDKVLFKSYILYAFGIKLAVTNI